MTDSQSPSPVIAPSIATTAGVFSQVRAAVDDRLHNTVSNPNRLPHTIAQGRAPKPRATINNDLVASIEAYRPRPGRQMAKSLKLDVQNTPPPQVDSIIDAIQRYLEIKPRREPTADPKAEASVARHPQQIIESSQRWANASHYRFLNNGVAVRQSRPEYNGWGGGLDLAIEAEGSADIAAPPTRSPWVGPPLMVSADALGEYPVHDPVNAAQAAMGQMLEAQAPKPQYITAGPGNMTADPAQDPAFVFQNAMSDMAENLAPPEMEFVSVGVPNQTADPELAPAYIFEKAVTDNRERLEREPLPQYRVGVPNMIDNVQNQPQEAWYSSTQVAFGLGQQSGLRQDSAASFRPIAERDAYQRAMHIMESLNRPLVVGGRI